MGWLCALHNERMEASRGVADMSSPSTSLAVDQAVRRGVEPVLTASTKLRADIQAMRGIAIILVMLHHAHFPYLPGGFLGVDIFFVISGFLMTGMIDEALENGRFTFASFYLRRARRLLPAAYATMAVTALFSMVFLDSVEINNFVAQLAGSFGFIANVILWRQADYFSSGALVKPLLHMWSLSLEEQYYIALPLIMFICSYRLRLPVNIALTLASIVLCIFFVDRNPVAAFYLLPTRAWELGIGSVVALLVRRQLVPTRPMPSIRIGCALAMLLVPLFATEQGHPGIAAIVVCAATGVLLIPGAQLQGWKAALKPLTMVGDRSYSLYLVHWPLFAFANNVFIAEVPAYVNAGLLLLCVLWAEAQYRLVEQRFRQFRVSATNVALLVAIPIAVVALTAAWNRSVTTQDSAVRQEAIGLSPQCEFSDRFEPKRECMSGPAPATMVWGDSFAMALSNGLAASSPGGIVQAAKAVCGPFLDIAPSNYIYTRSWSEGCIGFNRSVVDYLRLHPEIKTVILSSALAQYVPGAEDKDWEMISREGGQFHSQPQKLSVLAESLGRTVATIRSMGKHVVLFAPPPIMDFDIARCLDRAGAGKFSVSPYPDCTYTIGQHVAAWQPIHGFLSLVKQRNITPVYSIEPFLCGSGRCVTRLRGTMLYRDAAHLSAAGSRLLGKDMNWGHTMEKLAS